MEHTDRDVSLEDVITTDHREVETVFAELKRTRGHFEGRKEMVDHAIAELERHFAAEERFVFPDAMKRLPDGERLISREMEEHGEAEVIMRDLEAFGPEHPHYEQRLGELMDSVRHHVEDEEREFLPRIAEAYSEEELSELGGKLLRAKAVTPTRPDPHAAERVPEDRLLGPGPFIDKIRSALNQRTD